MQDHKIDVKAAFLLTQATAKTILLNDLKTRPKAYQALPGYLTETLAKQTAWEAATSGNFDHLVKSVWNVFPLMDHAADIIQLHSTRLKMEYCPEFYGHAINCLTGRRTDIGHSTVVLFLLPDENTEGNLDSLAEKYAAGLSGFLGEDFPFKEHVADVTGRWQI